MATHSSILAWRIPMDREDGQAAVHGVTKSQTCLSTCTHKILILLSSVMGLIFILLCPLVADENVFICQKEPLAFMQQLLDIYFYICYTSTNIIIAFLIQSVLSLKVKVKSLSHV